MKRDKHLPPGVYLKHGAYYHVRSRKWVRIGATLQEALAEYAVYIAAPKGGMASLIDAALNHMRPRLAANTLEQYGIAARNLKKWLHEFAPEQVRPRDVVAIKRKLMATPSYANRVLSFLRLVFDYALEAELVESNPCVGVKRFPEAKRTRLLTLEELRAIYAHAGPRLQVIIALAVHTGQRIGDVLAIRHVDITEAGIRFKQQKTGAKGTVAWTPALRAAVDRAREGRVLSMTYLLQAKHGRPPGYRTVRDQWATACRSAGVSDAHLHDLRAFAATEARRQGVDPTALLMHADAAQTERYLRDRKPEPVVSSPLVDLVSNPAKG